MGVQICIVQFIRLEAYSNTYMHTYDCISYRMPSVIQFTLSVTAY